jgi:hypothetical protein
MRGTSSTQKNSIIPAYRDYGIENIAMLEEWQQIFASGLGEESGKFANNADGDK